MPNDDHASEALPVVALGGSAGGLAAFQAFFDAVPTDTGIAYILLQHLADESESLLPSLIQRHTKVSVATITDGMHIAPDVVHVLPAGYDLQIKGGIFQLSNRQPMQGWSRVINNFLISLAEDKGERVAALIFSGMGDDGCDGARAVHQRGGMVIAQHPESAAQSSMPQSIIDEELADAVLLPAQMPEALLNYFDIHISPTAQTRPDDLSSTLSEADVSRLTQRLYQQTGKDFAEYKRSTLRRQIARRMGIRGCQTIDEYLAYMNDHSSETEDLVKHLLINVTNFFRDPEAFNALKEQALLPMLRDHNRDTEFRIWVPGCASGEEAISIAIMIYEVLQELDKLGLEVRIFATDLSRELVYYARLGAYPLTIAEHISEERLHAHFIKEDDAYQLRNHIQRMIVCAEHNLVEHPPFSNLHLISCRNVLIYFQRRLQERVLAHFQFGLRPGGILFLGSSEAISHESESFITVDSQHKIFQRSDKSNTSWLRLSREPFVDIPDLTETMMPDDYSPPSKPKDHELQIIQSMLLDHYTSTCILVDDNYHVQYTYGEVDPYLRVVPGKEGQNNILAMARPGLDNELTIALHQAYEQNKMIERSGVWIKTNGDERVVNLTVQPITDERLAAGTVLIIIEQLTTPATITALEDEDFDEESDLVQRLRRELAEAQESLRSSTQALQAKSEELTSSMEEIRSAHEEVQTTNEELRTSKQELESMNEELNTLNTQLIDQNEELTHANNTLHNFLRSTEVGVIFLDQDLFVREFTQAVTELFGLRKSDTGRPLSEIASQLRYDALIQDAEYVLNTLNNVKKEVQATDERWYELRIRPYRTTTNAIDGLVLTFSDVTERKRAYADLEQRTRYIRYIFDTIDNSLIELDENLVVLSANQSFYELFQVEEADTVGKRLYKLGNGQWDIPELRALLYDIISEQEIVRDYVVTHDFPQLGRHTMRLNARQIEDLERILLVITDISAADDTDDADTDAAPE